MTQPPSFPATVRIVEDNPEQPGFIEKGMAYIDNSRDVYIFDTSSPKKGAPAYGTCYLFNQRVPIGIIETHKVGDRLPDGWRRFHGTITITFP